MPFITNQSLDWRKLPQVASSPVEKLKCVLCEKRLSFFEPVGPNVEPFTLLPCGHAVGWACIQLHFLKDASASCPSCGKSARHKGCGHVAQLEKIEQDAKTGHTEMVGVKPEMFAPVCEVCLRLSGNKKTTKQKKSWWKRIAK
ncbi:hypothetical protein F5Y17DRAFT_438321 [Xylariaceae sp. FL0594]|nr:hypothetical protein F5Y17DRAFT_438321 [Xylariaceae sp. FL0594]